MRRLDPTDQKKHKVEVKEYNKKYPLHPEISVRPVFFLVHEQVSIFSKTIHEIHVTI